MLNEYSKKHLSREGSSTNLSRTNSLTGLSYKRSDLDEYLDNNKTVDVYVSAVAHPLLFWVQVIDNLPTLETMNEQLDNFFVNNPKTLFVNLFEVF